MAQGLVFHRLVWIPCLPGMCFGNDGPWAITAPFIRDTIPILEWREATTLQLSHSNEPMFDA